MQSENKQLTNILLSVQKTGEMLIKDFLNPGDCRLLFDQQDLRTIMNDYRQLGYIDIDNSNFQLFDNIIEDCLQSLNESNILTLILIKGGDINEIRECVRESSLSKHCVQNLYAYNNFLIQSTSVRIYFFDKSSKMDDTLWKEKLNQAINVLSSGVKFESFNL